MNALETLLRPVTALINRKIAATTPARELAVELDEKVLAVRVADTAIAAYLLVKDGELLLSTTTMGEPDVVISGSLFSLARLAGPAGEDLMREGVVDIVGDAVIAQQFRRLLNYGRPDLEEELSNVIGDVAAHGVGEVARGVGRWGREASAIVRQNVSEYLQEESRVVPSRYEIEHFSKHVETLRDDVDRLEARLNRLSASHEASGAER
jgi:ubiquinone biosynthesis protein UbiJ